MRCYVMDLSHHTHRIAMHASIASIAWYRITSHSSHRIHIITSHSSQSSSHHSLSSLICSYVTFTFITFLYFLRYLTKRNYYIKILTVINLSFLSLASKILFLMSSTQKICMSSYRSSSNEQLNIAKTDIYLFFLNTMIRENKTIGIL